MKLFPAFLAIACMVMDSWGYETELKPSVFCKSFDEKIAAEAAAAGFEGVEVCAPRGGLDEATARAWRALADRNGLKIHAMIGGWYLFENPEKFEAELERARRDLSSTAVLGAEVMLIVPAGRVAGNVVLPPQERGAWKTEFDSDTAIIRSVSADGKDYSEYVALQNAATRAARKAIRSLLPLADKVDVTLAVEDVGNLLWVDPSHLAAFIRGFNSPRVKLFADPVNLYRTSDPAEWLLTMKGLVARLHVKDLRYSFEEYEFGADLRNFGEGDVDLKSIREMVERIGYSGWFSLEGTKGLTLKQAHDRLARFVNGEEIAPGAVNDALPGRWALDRACGWVGIRELMDGSNELTVLWDCGSPVKFTHVKTENGVISAYMDYTPGDQILEMKPSWHYYRYAEMRVVNGQLKGWFMMLNGEGKAMVPRTEFTGTRIPDPPVAPDLASLKYGEPIDLLSGGLDGWERIDMPDADTRKFGWFFKDGVLGNLLKYKSTGVAIERGFNLVTKRHDFEDFKISYDVRVPKMGNSGVFLRGIYEIQAIDSYGKPLDCHNMAAFYGRITPTVSAEKPAGEWQHVDVVLCDRHVTVTLNGVRIIDNKPILGVTGGSLSSDESKPGPIYLQGDHTCAEYRNMVLTPILK